MNNNTDNSSSDNNNNNNYNSNSSSNNNNSNENIDKNKINLNYFNNNLNYDSITIKQLKEIATSLNISSINNKNELYNRIKSYLITEDTINKDIIIKQDSLNSIWIKDKPKLIINNSSSNSGSNRDSENKNELLFWSIFRNKILFNQVFSKFIYKESNSYNEIIGIEYTFNHFSNSLDIIIDKLKSNNHIINNKSDVIKIFSLYNNNNSSSSSSSSSSSNNGSGSSNGNSGSSGYNKINQLYYQLFNNFKSPLIQFNNTSKWLNEIIKSYNLIAFNQYISFFKISKESIREMININFNINNYYAIKMVSYLFINQYLKESQMIHIPNFNNDNIKEIKIMSIKFKQLIKLFNYIMILVYDNSNNNNKEYTYNSLINKDQYKYNQLIVELKQVQLDHYTHQQLNSTTRELLLNNSMDINSSSTSSSSTNNIKSILYKYYKVLFSINKIYNNHIMKDKNRLKKPIEYYIYFKCKSKIINMLKLKGYRIGVNIPSDLALDLYQVSIIGGSKKDRIEIYPDTFRKGIHHCNYESDRYCKSIIASNDLELIKLIPKKSMLKYYRNNKPEVLKSITRPEVLEYYINNQIITNSNNQDWNLISNIQVLKHYETLLLNKSISASSDSSNTPSSNNPPSTSKPFIIGDNTLIKSMNPQVLIRAFNETSIYEFELSLASFNSSFEIISTVLKDKDYREDRFKIIYSIIKTLDIKDLYIWNLFDFNSIKYCGDLLNWIFNNYNNNIQMNDYIDKSKLSSSSSNTDSNKTYHLFKKDLINYLCYGGRSIVDINKLFQYQVECKDQDQVNKFPISILKSYIYYCIDIKLDSWNIYKLLLIAATKGYMDIFKSIISKYGYILKKKNNPKSNSGILEMESLLNIIDTSIKNNNTELAYILINYIGLDDKKYKLYLNKINT